MGAYIFIQYIYTSMMYTKALLCAILASTANAVCKVILGDTRVVTAITSEVATSEFGTSEYLDLEKDDQLHGWTVVNPGKNDASNYIRFSLNGKEKHVHIEQFGIPEERGETLGNLDCSCSSRRRLL